MTDRINRLKKAVQEAVPGVCPERALLWTQYFKNSANRKKPAAIRIAEAVSHVLENKSIRIYPDEILAGNYTSRRVGGIIYPESHGISVLMEIFRFHRRSLNPLETLPSHRWKLAAILPFWLNRNIIRKAFPTVKQQLAFTVGQLTAKEYQIYETGGISHLTPNHEKLLAVGLEGFLKEIEAHESKAATPEQRHFYQATGIAARGLIGFAERYAALAREMAGNEPDPGRKADLKRIADACQRVPRLGANTFFEAVQAMLLTHISLFQESLGESLCVGRMDQILWPYYQKDLSEGRLTRERAKEILGAFCIKLSETVPVYPEILAKTLGGLTSYQVVTSGGVDREGADATNELSYILLELMDELRMRQPNSHVRIHKNTPEAFYDKVVEVTTGKGSAPALYNDETIIAAMLKAGYTLADARNYVAIGCVEPTSQGKTLGSTDAAIINMPLAMELALNEGRRFGSRRRTGAKTMAVSQMKTMADVTDAYRTQLRHQLGKLKSDLQAIEKAHAAFHPTPLTSMLIDGCLDKGKCSTAGGAVYNFSGIQGVGVSTVGDSLYAVEKTVFADRTMSLVELVDHLKNDLADEAVRSRLRRLEKFGNDRAEADQWTRFVMDDYADAMAEMGQTTRGGRYNAGLYSNTTHIHFAHFVGALPNGRRRGEPFASGIAPENGMDRRGPTALVNSMNRLDFTRMANGINFNIKFNALNMTDDAGKNALGSIFRVYFNRGGMQVQANMLDPKMLMEARDNPSLHPHLLVRVSGYSAYFNDLSPEMKDEIIARSFIAA
ncbi:MAG: pyruvate formate lyase family protein [Thermodesulfobacteriota bacterium]